MEAYCSCFFLLVSALILACNIDIYPKIAGLSTMRNPYAYLGIDEAYGAIARLLFYILVFLMMLAIMIIIPEKKAFYTIWGEDASNLCSSWIYCQNFSVLWIWKLVRKLERNILAIFIDFISSVIIGKVDGETFKKSYVIKF